MPAGATLMLYTDGLVERRGNTLDDGISRAVGMLAEHRDSALEDLVDVMMSGLAPEGGYHDDVVLLLCKPPAPLERTFPAHPAQLAGARTALRDWLRQVGVGQNQIVDLLVATGEAVANAIEHGHRDRPEGGVRCMRPSRPTGCM